MLDGALATGVLLMALHLLPGPLDLGLFTLQSIARPLLVTVLLLSVRLSIPVHSQVSRASEDAWRLLCHGYWRFARSTPWAAAWSDAAIAVLATRIMSKAIDFAANVLIDPERPRAFAMPFKHVKFAETFAAWDSGWYFDIARRGYYFNPDGQSSIAFFPLYPMLMRALAWPFGGTERALWIAGIVISYASFFLALVLLHRLAERIAGSREAARRTVLYVAVFPFSYFFTRVYTEALFLLLTVAAVYAAVSARWTVAGLVGALAALTRPNGALIAVPLFILALQGAGGWRDRLRRLGAVLAVPIAVSLYCGFVYVLAGHPLAWLHAQNHWSYSVGNRPWSMLISLVESVEKAGWYSYIVGQHSAFYALMHGLVAFVFILLTPSVFRRLGFALGSYVAVSLLVPLSGSALEGIGRYASTLFPAFILIGAITSRRVHETLLIVGSFGFVLLLTLFVTLHPIY